MGTGQTPFRFDSMDSTVCVTELRNEVLESCSQERLFSLILNEPVRLDRPYCNPLRKDRNPGCWFKYFHGRLFFTDFAYDTVCMDPFQMVQRGLNLSSYLDAVRLVKSMLESEKITPSGEEEEAHYVAAQSSAMRRAKQRKEGSRIYIQVRDWCQADAAYWKPYGISKANLRQNCVMPVLRFMVGRYRSPELKERVYAYTNFEDGKMKLYFPDRKKGGKRFLTNCRKNDIGVIEGCEHSDTLVITKSYKDAQVIANAGYSVIWLQNEGMIPDRESLAPYLKGHRSIAIAFDRDAQGISAADKLRQHLEQWVKVPTRTILPDEGCKDFAEQRMRMGSHEGFADRFKRIVWIPCEW